MALNSINPTQTKAWSKLKEHFEAIKDDHMKTWFKENPGRADEFTIQWDDFYVDFSKNRISSETMSLFKDNHTDFVSSPNSNPITLLHSCEPKNFHQWQNIRRAMGSQYHTLRVQKQLIRDAQALGSAFYENNNSMRHQL